MRNIKNTIITTPPKKSSRKTMPCQFSYIVFNVNCNRQIYSSISTEESILSLIYEVEVHL